MGIQVPSCCCMLLRSCLRQEVLLVTHELDTKQHPHAVSCWEMIANTWPDAKLPQREIEGAPWTFLLSSASFAAGNLSAVNHFTPLWIATMLSPDERAQIQQETQAEIDTLRSLLESQSRRALKPSRWSFVESMKESLEKSMRFQRIQTWLEPSGYMASDVPADGNCAVWALMALQTGNPFLSTGEEAFQNAMQSVRDQLSQFWLEVSTDPDWQSLFFNLVAPEDNEEHAPTDGQGEHDVRETVPNAVKREDFQTPKKRKKSQLPVFVDLTTPPRKTDGEDQRAKVTTVGAQVGAMDLSRRSGPIEIPPSMPGLAKAEPGKGRAQRKKLKAMVEETLPVEEPRAEPPVQEEEACEDDRDAQEKKTSTKSKKEKRKRRRTCKTKKKTHSERKLAAVKAYLASIEVTWSFSQKYHRRIGLGQAFECKQFRRLQESLASLQEPSCTTCLAMLKGRGFNMDVLRAHLEHSVDENYPESPAITQLKVLNPDLGAFLDGLPAQESSSIPLSSPDGNQDPEALENLQLVPLSAEDPAAAHEPPEEAEELGMAWS